MEYCECRNVSLSTLSANIIRIIKSKKMGWKMHKKLVRGREIVAEFW